MSNIIPNKAGGRLGAGCRFYRRHRNHIYRSATKAVAGGLKANIFTASWIPSPALATFRDFSTYVGKTFVSVYLLMLLTYNAISMR